jgi:hypothetical protein
MPQSIHTPVRLWTLPRAALAISFEEIAADGVFDREGICLWGGRRYSSSSGDAADVDVTHVIKLRGDGILRRRDFIGISSALFNDITDALADIGDGVYLIGQIHSHPPYSSVDLSPTDIKYGIAAPQFLSVVAPRFGMDAVPSVGTCGVHISEPPRWRRLSEAEARDKVVVTDGSAESITVGESAGGSSLSLAEGGDFDAVT